METVLFSTSDYAYLLPELLAISKFSEGSIEQSFFPDGECYHRIDTEVRNKKALLVGGTHSDAATLELLDIANGLFQWGVSELHIVIPYFGYSTMERAVKEGEIVKAKTRANLISSLGHSFIPIRLYLFDLHSEGIPYYFSNNIITKHIYGKNFVKMACHRIAPNFVLASTDAGRAKWVESLANDLGVKSAFVYKHRLSGEETSITGINAEVAQEHVIIYDDMIRTGGSLMKAAEVYQNKGAKSVSAICSHGVFSDDCLDKIAEQGIIQKVFCTNSHPAALAQKSPLLEVLSIAGTIFEEVKT